MDKKYYIAKTYDRCEHENFCVEMNEYIVESLEHIKQFVNKIAENDIAPLVKVYESISKQFNEIKLYKQYEFKQYECHCNK